MERSIFTKILAGEIAGEIIYQDDTTAVLLTIEPLSPGHMLVIPKTEVDHLWDVDNDTYHHMWDVAKLMVARLKKTYGYQRIGVEVEGYGVPHAHIHVFGLIQPLEPTIVEHARDKHFSTAEELAEVAAKLTA